MRVLLDTSFFVARETGLTVRELPPEVSETEVSVVTLAELMIGVLTANNDNLSNRVATLSALESTWEPLPINAEVARKFAQIVAKLKAEKRKLPIMDALLAATSVVEGIPIVTQDLDYDTIPDVEVIHV